MRSDDVLPNEDEQSFDILQNLDKGLDDEPAGGSKLPRKRTAFPGHSRDALSTDDDGDLFSSPLNAGDTAMFFAAAGADPAQPAEAPAPAAADVDGGATVLMSSLAGNAPEPAAPASGDDQATVLMGAPADEDARRTVLLDDLDEGAIDRPVATRRLSLDDSEELPSLGSRDDDDQDETEFKPYTFAEDDDEEGGAAAPNAGTWINYGFDGDDAGADAAKRKRIAIFVGIAIVAVALIGTLVWFFFLRSVPEPEPVKPEPIEQEEEEPEPLTATLTVDAPEWVADYGTFNFSITDATGAEVAAPAVEPGTPMDVTLPAGTYTVTATQIPSLADGRTYSYMAPHTFEVTEDMLKEGAPLSDAWSFTIIDPNDQAAVDAAVSALPADQQDAARAFYDGRKAAEPAPAETTAPADTDADAAADAGTSASGTGTTTSRTPSYSYNYSGNAGTTYTPPASSNSGSSNTGGGQAVTPAPTPDPGIGGSTGNAGTGDTGGSGDMGGGSTGGDETGGGTTGGGGTSTGGGNTSTGGSTGDTSTVDPGGPAVGIL